jgi:hypothetical protein
LGGRLLTRSTPGTSQRRTRLGSQQWSTCTRAREERADRLFEELFEIADKPCTNQVEVQQQRNRLDTRKWALSKLAPRKYGDRLEHDHKGGLDFRPAILIQVSGGEREDDAKLIEGD